MRSLLRKLPRCIHGFVKRVAGLGFFGEWWGSRLRPILEAEGSEALGLRGCWAGSVAMTEELKGA